MPDAAEGGQARAGAVDIYFAPDTRRTTQRFGESRFGRSSSANDTFGAALTFLAATGAVTLTGRTAGEHFGSAVVARGHDLWIAAPDRTVSGVEGAGAVDHYRVVNGAATLIQTLTENTSGISGAAEAGDRFGAAVTSPYDLDANSAATVSVGVPGEAVGRVKGAGTVDIMTVTPKSQTARHASAVTQNSPGVPGGDEAYDHFGAQVAYVAGALCVNVPGEDNDPSSGGGELLSAVPGAVVSGHAASGQLRIESRVAITDSSGPVTNERYAIPAYVVDLGPHYSG
ncbi:hypothetical protein [uncultured Jatrophihabitans sp.]|uniref:hypothetical protein n=1 Tax=uncultured Jatrophihabitans sp. TaxID=1610747 RepID=UPI0035C986CB